MPGEGMRIAEPIRVGGMDLANRIVMGSMHSGLEGHPERFGELARFYAERAKGGAALIVTGGFSPDFAGRIKDDPCTFETPEQAAAHRVITEAVRAEGGRIILQLLHAGRYGYHDAIVAPSPVQAPINRIAPREMTGAEIRETIASYGRASALALEAGYDGVEIMGSEGYLISQFLAQRTNFRTDEWGGSLEARARFPLEVVRATRAALGDGPILSYRISAAEFVEGGLDQDEIAWLAGQVEAAGADCLNTGIGWHESKAPTIAGVVPHAAFAQAAGSIKRAVGIPVIASNRINLPSVAEKVLRDGQADMISMARPFLADAAFPRKAISGRPDLVNVCIACNQACLDHYFTGEIMTCLVNPRALRELEFDDAPAPAPQSIGIVGAGVSGIACALEAARRGHRVTLYEAAARIGGQLRLAGAVPGKEDYLLALDGFETQLSEAGVTVSLGAAVTADQIRQAGHDAVVLATGVTPRAFEIAGADDPRVVGYTDVLEGRVEVGRRVLIIGGGGIGHDVALFLAHGASGSETQPGSEIEAFETRWGLAGDEPKLAAAAREITMLKRSPGRFGGTLGKSTGWILRQELKDYGVRQLAEVEYLELADDGLHIRLGDETKVLPADTVVVCAGQERDAALVAPLEAAGVSVHVIGGARVAAELDAKRSIAEGARLGNRL